MERPLEFWAHTDGDSRGPERPPASAPHRHPPVPSWRPRPSCRFPLGAELLDTGAGGPPVRFQQENPRLGGRPE